MLLEDAIKKNQLAQEKKKKAQARAIKKREKDYKTFNTIEEAFDYIEKLKNAIS
jgi:hypothetical protein